MKLDWGVFRAETDLKNKLNDKTFIIHAGSIHGVDKNSLFDLYKTAAVYTHTNEPVCRLRVESVSSLRSTGVIEGSQVEMIKAGFVCQVRSGKPLKVHFTTAFLGVVSERSVVHHADIDGRVEVVTDERSADIIVDMEDEKVLFTTSLKHVTLAGHEFMLSEPARPDPECVSRVLAAASRWKQHLEISSPAPWINNVKIEFFPLEAVEDEMGFGALRRMGTAQLNNESNLVSLVVPPDNADFYGMVIRNGTALDLHVTIVAFSIDNLVIGKQYSSLPC